MSPREYENNDVGFWAWATYMAGALGFMFLFATAAANCGECEKRACPPGKQPKVLATGYGKYHGAECVCVELAR